MAAIELNHSVDCEPATRQEIGVIQDVPFETQVWKSSVGGSTVESTLLIPDNPVSEVPIAIAGGLGAPKCAYDAMARYLASHGHTVAYWKPPRNQLPLAALHPLNRKDVLRIQSQAGGITLKGVTDRLDTDTFDIGGHSMGFLVAVRMATHLPEGRVRAVISIAGAGLDGPGSASRHKNRIGSILKNEILDELGNIIKPNDPLSFSYGALSHILRNPIRLVREAVACLDQSQIETALLLLKERGIKIGALLPELDEFFHHHEVLDKSGHLLDWHRIIPGAKHVHPHVSPQEHAKILHEAIHSLNA